MSVRIQFLKLTVYIFIPEFSGEEWSGELSFNSSTVSTVSRNSFDRLQKMTSKSTVRCFCTTKIFDTVKLDL